jgi:hypothetical protein
MFQQLPFARHMTKRPHDEAASIKRGCIDPQSITIALDKNAPNFVSHRTGKKIARTSSMLDCWLK